VVYSVKRRHVCNTIGCNKNESEFVRVKNFVFLCFKVAFRTWSGKLSRLTERVLVHIHGLVVLTQVVSIFSRFLFGEFKVVLQVFAPSELFKHNHLILAILWRFRQQLLFLHLLSHIDNTCPVLLILCLKIFEEFVEAWVSFRHTFNAGVQTLALFLPLRLNKRLNFLNLSDCLRSAGRCFARWSIFVAKKQHLGLLVAILVHVIENLWRYACSFCGEEHSLVANNRSAVATWLHAKHVE